MRSFRQACLNFYKKKTYDRLELFHQKETSEEFLSCSINGSKILPISELLALIDWSKISSGVPSRFHGDLQFDNIIHSPTNGFTLIDWRQDFSGLTKHGDRYYDYAKLLGGFLVSYREIKGGNFSYKFGRGVTSIRVPKVPELDVVKLHYYEFLESVGVDIQKVCILTSLIFLNMAPLHTYPFSHVLYSLGRQSLDKSLNRERL